MTSSGRDSEEHGIRKIAHMLFDDRLARTIKADQAQWEQRQVSAAAETACSQAYAAWPRTSPGTEPEAEAEA